AVRGDGFVHLQRAGGGAVERQQHHQRTLRRAWIYGAFHACADECVAAEFRLPLLRPTMLLAIPEVLSKEQLASFRAALDGATWVDGRATAGHQSARAKHNVQLAEDDPLSVR